MEQSSIEGQVSIHDASMDNALCFPPAMPTDGLTLVTVPVRLFSDATGTYVSTQGLLGPYGVIPSLLKYCESRAHLRANPSWARDVVHSVGLFLHYLHANRGEGDWLALLTGFAQRLYTGTFDHRVGYDPSWLCWRPLRRARAARVISCVRQFLAWLHEERLTAGLRHCHSATDSLEQRLADAAYQHRRHRSLLGYTWQSAQPENNIGAAPFVRGMRAVTATPADPPAFPEDRFEELLFRGFRVRGRLSYRDMLITLLQHGASFRVSEPFHLYTEDVRDSAFNPGSASVLLHHPSEGAAPVHGGGGASYNRAQYLRAEWELVPRTELPGTRHAGWKGGRLEKHGADFFYRAYWAPPHYGELFRQLWYEYLQESVHVPRNHPFAFVNLLGGEKGGMYCISKYCNAHAAAVTRIGLTVAKELGTTPHGHRHAYGGRLRAAGVDPLIRMLCMHHISERSQEAYTAPGYREIIEQLTSAAWNADAPRARVAGATN